MKKIIFLFSLLFVTNSFSVGLVDDGENLKKVLNTKIVCKNSTQLFENVEVLLKQIDGSDKFISVLKNNTKYITYKKTYELKQKFPSKSTKELKSLIRNGAEIEIVEYFNGKTISEVMNDEINMKKMGNKYFEKIENLENIKIKREISYRVLGITVKKMDKSIHQILLKIKNKAIKDKFEKALTKIEDRIGKKEMPMYLHGRTVYSIIKDGDDE